jgi:hypothetical protein
MDKSSDFLQNLIDQVHAISSYAHKMNDIDHDEIQKKGKRISSGSAQMAERDVGSSLALWLSGNRTARSRRPSGRVIADRTSMTHRKMECACGLVCNLATAENTALELVVNPRAMVSRHR